MNQYLKVPRGINVDKTNDIIMQETIEAIGRKYNRVLLGTFRSDYAKGKAYISKKYGVSKTALKKLHKTKRSIDAYKNIDVAYSNYVDINILFTAKILDRIIKSITDKNIDFLKIADEKSNGKYTENSLYIDVLFEETLSWMDTASMDEENLITFNRNEKAHEELINLYNEIKKITELIGG